MKLRLRGNTIRLRLSRGEVDALTRTHRVEEAVHFGGGVAFVYALVSSAEAEGLDARFEGSRLTVIAPAKLAISWAQGEEVGMSGERALDGGEPLRILVEKDFACVRPREGEDESDMFPHPTRC
jgi:hypothetical protein